jgi:AraC-like DNA-binding protein
MSPRTLRRHCAKTGLRLAAYKQALRRESVMQLLVTDLSIGTIAARLGFASSQTLARFIKKAFGSTATALRRQARRTVARKRLVSAVPGANADRGAAGPSRQPLSATATNGR